MSMEPGSKILSRYTLTSNVSKIKIEKILKFVKNEARCSDDIEKEIYASKSCIKYYIRYLLQQKLIYIHDWIFCTKGKRTMSYAHYKAGNLPSKEKPKPLTFSKKSIRYREKLKKDIDRLDLANAKRRAKRYKIQPADSWIKA